MNIIHTESSCGWGGQELRVLTESQAMQKRGHKLLVLAPPESLIYQRAKDYGVLAHGLPIAKKRLPGLFALRKVFANTPVDVVNTHSSTDSWLASLACATLSQAPAVVRTRHVSAPVTRSAANRWLYGRSVETVVTTGEIIRDHLIQTLSLDSHRVVSIPTGMDTERFRPAEPGEKASLRMKLGLEPDVQMVGIAATLRSWKGHEFLIDALALLARPGLHLVIIGDGPQWDNLQRKVVEAGLKGLVVFTGHQSNVHEWLRCLDIFCLPSYANEGVPQALIQAMLTALPCVTTAAGAISEIAIHGETALVCPMRDASALATAIGALLSDAQLAEELGLSARELCEAEHSLDTMADKMEQVFQQAIALKHKDMKP